MTNVKITLVTGEDITTLKSDCLLLKNVSDGLFGPEAAVNRASGGRLAGINNRLFTAPGTTKVLDGVPGIASRTIVLVGVGSGASIRYEHVGGICEKGTEAALGWDLNVRSISTVTHAVGFGLSRTEVFRAELFGFKKALERSAGRIREIVFLVGNAYLSQLEGILDELARGDDAAITSREGIYFLNIGVASQAQTRFEQRVSEGRYVFVAMPFKLEFENIFDFGMRLPIEQCGLLPMRVDKEAFTGSITQEIKKRIRESVLVIADVSESNPNVLYELGYAEGLGIPTILICQKHLELPFDLRDINTLFYERELLRNLNRDLIVRIRAVSDMRKVD